MNFYCKIIFCLVVSVVLTNKSSRQHTSAEERSRIDEEFYDSPDIEIDDTSDSDSYDSFDDPVEQKPDVRYYEHSDEEEVPDRYSSYIADKKSSSPLPPLRRNQICYPQDMSSYCSCQRSCFPDSPYSIEPCTCKKSNEQDKASTNSYDTQQPPLLASQPSIPSYSSVSQPQMSMFDCSFDQNANSAACSCQRACVPGVPVNYDPCTCMAFDNGNQMGAMDYGNVNPQPWVDYSNSMPTQLQPTYNYYDQSHINTPHLDETSCARACLPYAVQQQMPCFCNFDMKSASGLDAYGPSMYPNSYQYPYQSFVNQNPNMMPNFRPRITGYQRTPVEKALNADVPKVSRPQTSIGAYLGCFHDKKKTGRDLKMSVAIPKLTPDACVNKCREKKKRFAGVQNGYLCFCGSRFGRYNRTKDENCGTPCTGDPKKFCGGKWLNAVYSTDGQLYSPKQFSFRTKDPADEIEYDAVLRKQKSKIKKNKKNQNKSTKVKEHTKVSSASSSNSSVPASSLVTKKSKKHNAKTTTPKPSDNRRSFEKKSNHKHKDATYLENASSPSHMAELIALGDKRNKKPTLLKKNRKRSKSMEDDQPSYSIPSFLKEPVSKVIVHHH